MSTKYNAQKCLSGMSFLLCSALATHTSLIQADYNRPFEDIFSLMEKSFADMREQMGDSHKNPIDMSILEQDTKILLTLNLAGLPDELAQNMQKTVEVAHHQHPTKKEYITINLPIKDGNLKLCIYPYQVALEVKSEKNSDTHSSSKYYSTRSISPVTLGEGVEVSYIQEKKLLEITLEKQYPTTRKTIPLHIK